MHERYGPDMTLHPGARQLLDTIAEAGAPPLESLPVDQARALSGRMLEAYAAPPLTLAAVEEERIPGPHREIPARVYRPEGADPDGPLILSFHGGGWVLGDLDQHDPGSRALAQGTGATVVSVDYCLAPEHPYPAPLDEAYAAVCWAAEQSSAVAVTGDSAGGNLAAAVCLVARDRNGPAIAFQLLDYPALDVRMDTPSYAELADGYMLTASSMRWFWGHYLGGNLEAADAYASPSLAEDLSGLPPALVITAAYDPLRDEGERYAQRLREAGVDALSSRYDGMIHGFLGMPKLLPPALEAMEEGCTALRLALGLER